mgnify:FL=1
MEIACSAIVSAVGSTQGLTSPIMLCRSSLVIRAQGNPDRSTVQLEDELPSSTPESLNLAPMPICVVPRTISEVE